MFSHYIRRWKKLLYLTIAIFLCGVFLEIWSAQVHRPGNGVKVGRKLHKFSSNSQTQLQHVSTKKERKLKKKYTDKISESVDSSIIKTEERLYGHKDRAFLGETALKILSDKTKDETPGKIFSDIDSDHKPRRRKLHKDREVQKDQDKNKVLLDEEAVLLFSDQTKEVRKSAHQLTGHNGQTKRLEPSDNDNAFFGNLVKIFQSDENSDALLRIGNWVLTHLPVYEHKDDEDIKYNDWKGTAFLQEKKDFLSDYKNPCWKDGKNELACVPYIYILGVAKCGTTELNTRLTQHPQTRSPRWKEILWWDALRCGREVKPQNPGHSLRKFMNTRDRTSFDAYVDIFKAAFTYAARSNHELVTIDGTPCTFHNSMCWREFPGNEGLSEPRYWTPHHMYRLNPKQKFLIIVRNPVDRLYSEYHHINKRRNVSLSDFDREARMLVDRLSWCFEVHSIKQCVFNESREVFKGQMVKEVELHVGLYVVYLLDWLSVFPRDQIMVIRLEDYKYKKVEHLRQMTDFLELKPYSEKQLATFEDKGASNSNKQRYKRTGGMLEETRQLLEDFYRPFNRKLAEVLNQREFTWEYD